MKSKSENQQEEQAMKLSLTKGVEAIINGVDKNFPAALQHGECFIDVIELEAGPVEDLFDSPSRMEVYKRFEAMVLRGEFSRPATARHDDDTEKMQLAYGWLDDHLVFPIAIAYAGGLRAGGLSRDATRAALMSFFRLYNDQGSVDSHAPEQLDGAAAHV